jgi:catechol 2,3-dioxygenase-like lactoylglutathione lyase family enzyme
MALLKMEHYLVLTADIDATRGFYIHILGLADGFRPPLAFPGYWLYLDTTPVLHIAEWKTYTAHSERLGIPVTKPGYGTGSLDHIAFHAREFDAMCERLKRNGVAYHRNDAPEAKLVQLFIDDPNGIKLEINFFAKDQ